MKTWLLAAAVVAAALALAGVVAYAWAVRNQSVATLDRLLAFYPDLRFALIGDDTQGDLPAYAEAIESHPGRVAAVFIRTSAGEKLSATELAAKAMIEAAGVPLWMGASYEIGQDFLHAAGFPPGGDTEKIVARTKESA